MNNYNPFTLKGKTILITGASSGIGRATAIECSRLGASLIITARDQERLQETLTALDTVEDQRHGMIVSDITTDGGLEHLIEEVPLLDGVFSNAGILKGQAPVKFLKDDVIHELLETNIVSHVRLARGLHKKKKINKGGSYVFTASTGGVATHVLANSVYDITKAGINAFAKSRYPGECGLSRHDTYGHDRTDRYHLGGRLSEGHRGSLPAWQIREAGRGCTRGRIPPL